MSDDDLIRRGDALYAIAGWGIPSTAIAALPAVTVGVKPLGADGVKIHPQDILNAAWRDDLGEEGLAMYDRILAALEPVAAPDPVHRPTMTDMMVDPDTLDAFMEANPLPDTPDPAAIREAALKEAAAISVRHLSKVQINEPLWHEGQDWAAQRISEAILALIQKGTAE